jgi:hypothetical protein
MSVRQYTKSNSKYLCLKMALEAPDSDSNSLPDMGVTAGKDMSPANEAECQTDREFNTKSKANPPAKPTSPPKRKAMAKVPIKTKKVAAKRGRKPAKKPVEAKSMRSLRSKTQQQSDDEDSKIIFSVQPDPMSAERLRFLIGELLRKISEPKRLQALGFGRRAIDDVLHESILKSGRTPCAEEITQIERLRKNLEILLEWTIPKENLTQLRSEGCTTENILEGLAS